jgi:hypothetical protein
VLSSGLSNVTIRNNIIERLDSDAAVANVTEDHNVLGGTYGWTAAATDIRGTPAFVNPSGGDYRLAPRCLGIDVGSATGAPATDKACRPRYDDPATANRGVGTPAYVDAGALEFGPGTAAGDVGAGAACASGTAPPAGTPTPPPAAPATPAPGTGKASGCSCSAKGAAGGSSTSATAACAKRSTRGKAGKLSLKSARASHGRLLVTVATAGACRLSVAGSASWTWRGATKRARLTAAVRALTPGQARRVRIGLPRSVRKPLLAHKRLVLHLTVRTVSSDGLRTYRRVIRLRR